jgi:acyl phosphate:glycerol-3-phosphate acyltransferase
VPNPGYILTALVAYLLGSIPTGFLLAKAQGIDIRTVGSGNIGATNALRTLGKPVGIFVMLVDVAKGWVAVALVARIIWAWWFPSSDDQAREWLGICAGACAILGHNYTCWLGFKGGKGIATSAGAFFALAPWGLLIALGLWVLAFAATRYVSVASILAALVLPITVWFTTGRPALTVVTAVMAALAIYKHKTNIQRLLDGTESRFGSKKPIEHSEPNA